MEEGRGAGREKSEKPGGAGPQKPGGGEIQGGEGRTTRSRAAGVCDPPGAGEVAERSELLVLKDRDLKSQGSKGSQVRCAFGARF